MAKWVNRVVVAGGLGSTTDVLNPNSGTVLAGTAFVPTAGRFLVAIIAGPVTSSTPSGWVLPSLASAVNNNGLYCFTKASAAGSDTMTTTHNGDGTYPTVCEFLEFPSGTTFVGANFVNNASSAAGTASPSVTGLTGVNLHIGAVAFPAEVGNVWTWNNTELTDVAVGSTSPKWVEYTSGYTEDSAASSTSMTASRTPSGTTCERITIVLNVAASGSPALPPPLVMATRR